VHISLLKEGVQLPFLAGHVGGRLTESGFFLIFCPLFSLFINYLEFSVLYKLIFQFIGKIFAYCVILSMEILVESIKKQRAQLKLTQKEMADLCDMSERNYRYLEERSTGSVKTFSKVLKMLNVKAIHFEFNA
jgi:DNA-binding XRE family transcriptional regulator